jgi:hypothetical protein
MIYAIVTSNINRRDWKDSLIEIFIYQPYRLCLRDLAHCRAVMTSCFCTAIVTRTSGSFRMIPRETTVYAGIDSCTQSPACQASLGHYKSSSYRKTRLYSSPQYDLAVGSGGASSHACTIPLKTPSATERRFSQCCRCHLFSHRRG